MEPKPIGLLHAIFGLSISPFNTANRLMEAERPRHIISIGLVFIISLFLPFFYEINVLTLDSYRKDIISSVLTVIFCSYVLFIIVETLCLQILRIEMKFHNMMATLSYTLAPMIVALWSLYLVNTIFDGSITIVTKILTSHGVISDTVKDVAHIAFYYAVVWGVVIFASCIRVVSKGNMISSFLISLLSLVPMYICLIMGVTLAEMAIPGTLRNFMEVSAFMDTISEIAR
jgi:hypothetical protein